MAIEIIDQSISREQLLKIAKNYYENMVKGVVDIRREIVALGGDMHADAEEKLLKVGSMQSDLWGFNILLNKSKEECLIYDSFINIRPRDNNREIEVKDPEIRDQMKRIIFQRVKI